VHRDDASYSLGRDDVREEGFEFESMTDVKECRWFIEQEHTRLLSQGARHRHAPALASAERVQASLGELR
jgi:hypothetical protein